MGLMITKEKTETAENSFGHESVQTIDASDLYLMRLENSFTVTEQALVNLDLSPSKLGSASIWIPQINPERHKKLIELASVGEVLPITEGMFGTNMIEDKTQLWLRLLLATFKGSRLWTEYLEPHFNHVLFTSIYNEKAIQDAIVFDVERADGNFYYPQTPNSVLARRLSDLLGRKGVHTGYMTFKLDFAVRRLVEQEGIKFKENPDEWRRLYNYYWSINDTILLTQEMEEFMKSRTLVTIDVDLESKYSQSDVWALFSNIFLIEHIQKNIALDPEDRAPYFKCPILEMYLSEIYAKIYEMVVIGGRPYTRELVLDCANQVYLNKKTRYTFFAAVRSDLLAPSR